MPRIAISGHRDLTARTVRLVDAEVRAALSAHGPAMTGLSCLAAGADQIFARAVADIGGRLEAVIAAKKYRAGLPIAAQPEYDDLIAQAVIVHRLCFIEPTSESYMAASRHMIDQSDELYAVWDGQPARGRGGTADAVAYALERGTPVRLIWPGGAQRD
jgi:hypothetical protein